MTEGATTLESVSLGEALALALDELHENGIVHRDVKPTNIMLEKSNPAAPWLIDFGIARDLAAVSLTMTGDVLGTPGYLSPEQAMGNRRIGAQADVFSLGCVLYTCFAGTVPFPGTTPVAILSKVVLAEPTPLKSLRRDLPDPVVSLVSRMMNKNASHRPGMADVAMELGTIKSSLGAPTEKISLRRSSSGEAPTVADVGTAVVACLLVDATGCDLEVDELASRIEKDLVPADSAQVSRLGGKHFVVVLNGHDTKMAAALAASYAFRLIASLAPKVSMSVTVGTNSAGDFANTLDSASMMTERERKAGRIETDAATAELLRAAGIDVTGTERFFVRL